MRPRTAGRRARLSPARGCNRRPYEPLPDATWCPAHRWDGWRCQAPCKVLLGLEEPPGSQCIPPGFSSSYCSELGFTQKPRGFNFLSLSKHSLKWCKCKPSPKSQGEVNIASCWACWILCPSLRSSAWVRPAAGTSQAREELYGGKGFLLTTQFNYRCLGVCNVMDAGPAPMQGCSGCWHPHRAAGREDLGFTTHLSRLPQDYWRERNVLEKISQLLLKGTAFFVPDWDSHSSTAPDTLL